MYRTSRRCGKHINSIVYFDLTYFSILSLNLLIELHVLFSLGFIITYNTFMCSSITLLFPFISTISYNTHTQILTTCLLYLSISCKRVVAGIANGLRCVGKGIRLNHLKLLSDPEMKFVESVLTTTQQIENQFWIIQQLTQQVVLRKYGIGGWNIEIICWNEKKERGVCWI